MPRRGVNVAEQQSGGDSDWIWGNHRGGGGGKSLVDIMNENKEQKYRHNEKRCQIPAPLKSLDGSVVTVSTEYFQQIRTISFVAVSSFLLLFQNLRQVIKGAVEVDSHSPSQHRKLNSSYQDDDYSERNRGRHAIEDVGRRWDRDGHGDRDRERDRDRNFDRDPGRVQRNRYDEDDQGSASPKKFMSALRCGFANLFLVQMRF